MAGQDADFHRRDLFESIERGDYPEWELGLQILAEEDETKFDFDILNATKIIPEELVPVHRVGKLALNRNPDNISRRQSKSRFIPSMSFQASISATILCCKDGSSPTSTPNLAGQSEFPRNADQPAVRSRLTTISAMRWRGPRSTKGGSPISQTAWAAAAPMHSPEAADAFVSYAEKVDGAKIRARSDSFSDHFSQATQFCEQYVGLGTRSTLPRPLLSNSTRSKARRFVIT